MRHKKIFLFQLIVYSAFLSCVGCAQETSIGGMQKLQWLVGTWKMQKGKGTIYESWKVLDDSTLQSKSYKVSEKADTTILETVQLAMRNKEYYYIPTVRDQNNQQPVRFKINTIKEKAFVAENPAHDFPQRISYERTGASTLYAFIDGTYKDKYDKEEFNFEIVE